MSRVAIWMLCALLALVPLSTVEAGELDGLDRDALHVGHISSWFLFGGFGGGGSFTSLGNGGFANSQLSVVRMMRGRWIGAYADVQYDFSPGAFVAKAGPEVGYLIFGADAGLGAHFGDGGPYFGPQGRLMATVGVATLYGRYAYWPALDEQVIQVGLMLKLPLVAPWGYDPF